MMSEESFVERKKLLKIVQNLSQGFPPTSHVNRVIKNAETAGNLNQLRDHLVLLRLGQLLNKTGGKLVFEEPCRMHAKSRPHDLVLYLADNIRVVNEVRRFPETSWSQNHWEAMIDLREGFVELKDDPDRTTTGALDTLLKVIEEKKDQFDAHFTNVLWIFSTNPSYWDSTVEDAAAFYVKNWPILAAAAEKAEEDKKQPGLSHVKPEHLNVLGWMWDGDTSLPQEIEQFSWKPSCFLMSPIESVVLRVLTAAGIQTKDIEAVEFEGQNTP